ncbi:hypothetical protein DOQ08_01438 [Marinobacter litoralis]|uniref:Rho-binding antiterminator n=1 Tax=Marinobacter litoralis TaxID=187981 RepID=A0A3M2RFV8_9GAMM|nr:hypothetical protein [Marinobacter litoralis]RMJ04118.1 hypothetical protein DOQ08_01438 [Marinobacter litoralis]
MSTTNASREVISWSAQEWIREYIRTKRQAEIVYQDPSGQMMIVHEVLHDILSRAGHDFLVLGTGKVLGVERVLLIDGKELTKQ